MSERVEREFEQWQEMYDIPFSEKYNVKKLLELREELDNTPQEYVKTRKDLLSTIMLIQSNLHLMPRQRYNYTFLIVGNRSQIQFLRDLIEIITDEYESVSRMDNGIKMKFYNGVQIIMLDASSNMNNIRGMRVTGYINLTGDIELEKKCLQPLLRP